MSRRLAGLALPLALAACAMAPQPAPESSLDVPQGWRTAPPAVSTAVERDWWRAFGDPQLDALVEEALAGTPSLAAADARVRQAQAQAGVADAARQPNIGASVRYSGVQIPRTVAEPPIGGKFNASVMAMVHPPPGMRARIAGTAPP